MICKSLWLGSIFVLFSLSSGAFSANDSTASLIPSSLNPQDQYMLVNSSAPSSTTTSTQGASNQLITCANDEQLVGLIEHTDGGETPPGDLPYARRPTEVWNYVYVPRCFNPNNKGVCRRDWIKEYDKIDELRLVCAKADLKWENLNQYADPDDASTTTVVGAYRPPAPAP